MFTTNQYISFQIVGYERCDSEECGESAKIEYKKRKIECGRIISSINYHGTSTRPLSATSSKRDNTWLVCKGATDACVSVVKSSLSLLVLTHLRLKSHNLGTKNS